MGEENKITASATKQRGVVVARPSAPFVLDSWFELIFCLQGGPK